MEFLLVAAVYDHLKKPVEEWECPKCHKVVAKELLREESSSSWDRFLHDWCQRENEKKQRRDNNNS